MEAVFVQPTAPPSPFQPYFAVADAITALFQPFVEAVVHDMRTDQVVYVANPLSPRSVGDPSEMSEVGFTAETHVIGPYEKINWDGRRLKSISVVLRDNAGVPAGLLCINADVTEFETVQRMLHGFLRVPEPQAQAPVRFHDDWHAKLNQFVADWTGQRNTRLERLTREQRQELIQTLHETGAFQAPRAAAYVAQLLGISRATVYSQLARCKNAA
jgi:predicted transcriptional regulator YheO